MLLDAGIASIEVLPPFLSRFAPVILEQMAKQQSPLLLGIGFWRWTATCSPSNVLGTSFLWKSLQDDWRYDIRL